MARIHVAIERLIIEGLPLDARQAALLQQALESELTRLFAVESTDAFTAGEALARLRAEPITWNPSAGVGALGEQLGQTVYGSLES